MSHKEENQTKEKVPLEEKPPQEECTLEEKLTQEETVTKEERVKHIKPKVEKGQEVQEVQEVQKGQEVQEGKKRKESQEEKNAPPHEPPKHASTRAKTASQNSVKQQKYWKEEVRQKLAKLTAVQRVIHFHLRRLITKTHVITAGYHIIGPILFLFTAGAIGVAVTLSSLYATSYRVLVDGQEMGVVLDHNTVELAVLSVEKQGKSILGEEYHLENEILYDFGLHLKSELSDSSQVEHFLYSQLDGLGAALARYAVKLNGAQVAVLEQEEGLQQVLNQILDSYSTEYTISAEFVEQIVTEKVYAGDFTSVENLSLMLTENTTGETTYTVKSGDTFNGIAYQHDMSSSELQSLNPNLDPDRLYVNDVLNVKEIIPLLSVQITDRLDYIQALACPVEEVSDPNSYVGTSKITQQGVEGEARVTADVTYLNGREIIRDVIASETLQEPTTTIRSVGTAERPKTASYGSFVWPTRGTISSYFGGRQLYGSYNYHSGLDIAAPYGTAVYAADGGTVTFSGWRSSYGNLVIITHDNGMQTYYAHNSSLLVSSGAKVYRGQQIARVGSTGNSTGNHLHFEVRIGGNAVNPLSYLP